MPAGFTATEIQTLLTGAGLILGIGFLAQLLFERTRIPDILILLGIGYLVGPLAGWVSVDRLAPYAPLLGAIAVAFILFDGGLDFELDKLLGQFIPATGLILLTLIPCILLVAAGAHYACGLSWHAALLLGVIVSNTSGPIVLPIIGKLKIPERDRYLLALEAALTDILVVVVFVTLLEIAGAKAASASASGVFNALLGSFSIGAMLGVVVGLAWIKTLGLMANRSLAYIVTLGVVFLLYGGSEYLRASGGVAVLTLGIVLANSDRFRKFFNMKSPVVDTRALRATHTEFTFFIRTFFFVYAGLFLPAARLSAEEVVLLASALAGVLLSRYLGSGLFAIVLRRGTAERMAYTVMLPRGLIVAVLAGIPAAHGIPGTAPFARIAAAVIVVTNVVMTVGVVLLERHYGRSLPPASPAPVPVPSA